MKYPYAVCFLCFRYFHKPPHMTPRALITPVTIPTISAALRLSRFRDLDGAGWGVGSWENDVVVMFIHENVEDVVGSDDEGVMGGGKFVVTVVVRVVRVGVAV